jgi:hypothetical protein
VCFNFFFKTIFIKNLINNETPRSKKLRGISTKDISNNNAASSGVFTPRENKIIRNALTPVCFINIRLGIFFYKISSLVIASTLVAIPLS